MHAIAGMSRILGGRAHVAAVMVVVAMVVMPMMVSAPVVLHGRRCGFGGTRLVARERGDRR